MSETGMHEEREALARMMAESGYHYFIMCIPCVHLLVGDEFDMTRFYNVEDGPPDEEDEDQEGGAILVGAPFGLPYGIKVQAFCCEGCGDLVAIAKAGWFLERHYAERADA